MDRIVFLRKVVQKKKNEKNRPKLLFSRNYFKTIHRKSIEVCFKVKLIFFSALL